MYSRRGLSDEEILIELEGDVSDGGFSDDDFDEYEEVSKAIRAQLEGFMSEEEPAVGLQDLIEAENAALRELASPQELARPQEEQYLEDDEPGTSADARRATTWRKRNIAEIDTEWNGEEVDPMDFDDWTPLQYFRYFMDDDVMKHIVEQTNLYAVQKDVNTSFRTTEMDLRRYLGINILSGIVKMPSYRMYWAHATRFPPIADAMARNSFEKLKSNLHLNDNSLMKPRDHEGYDKLFKIRLFLEKIRKNFQKICSAEHNSIDEVLIPCKARQTIVQYIKSKPHKWGVKMFARCSSAGFMNDFEVYTGKATPAPSTPSALGVSGDVVLRLCQDLPNHQNYKVYTDNWFSSYKLAVALKEKGILIVGAVRHNRLPGCRFEDDKVLKKKGRGAFDFKTEVQQNIFGVKWFDNKSVHMVSSYVGIDPMNNVQRWSTNERRYIEIPRPQIIAEYNQYMGGVDLSDMLVSLYRINIGTKRYYLRIFFHLVDVCIVNAWLLYRHILNKTGVKTVKPLVTFKAEVAHGLLTYGRIYTSRKGTPTTSRQPSESPSGRLQPGPSRLVTVDSRLDNIGHLPQLTINKNRCKNCNDRNAYSRTKCIKCDAYLCYTTKRNCFIDYHTKK